MPSAKQKAAAKAKNLAELKPFVYMVKVTSTVLSYAPQKWVAMPTIDNILNRGEVTEKIFSVVNLKVVEQALKGVKFNIKCPTTGHETSFGFTADEVKFHNALKDAIMKCQFNSDSKEYDATESNCAYAVAIFNRRNGSKPDAVKGFKTSFDKADLIHQVKTTRSVVKLMAEVAAIDAKDTPLGELASKLSATKQIAAAKK